MKKGLLSDKMAFISLVEWRLMKAVELQCTRQNQQFQPVMVVPHRGNHNCCQPCCWIIEEKCAKTSRPVPITNWFRVRQKLYLSYLWLTTHSYNGRPNCNGHSLFWQSKLNPFLFFPPQSDYSLSEAYHREIKLCGMKRLTQIKVFKKAPFDAYHKGSYIVDRNLNNMALRSFKRF